MYSHCGWRTTARHQAVRARAGSRGHDGGMAEYLLVPATRYLIPLGNLDRREAAPLTDAGLTSYHAVKRSLQLLGPGSTAVLIGALAGWARWPSRCCAGCARRQPLSRWTLRPTNLQIAEKVGADAGLFSGNDAVTPHQGPHSAAMAPSWSSIWSPSSATLAMAAQMAQRAGSPHHRRSRLPRRCPSTSSVHRTNVR